MVRCRIGLQGAFLGFDVDKITDIHCHDLGYCPDIAEWLEVQFTNQPRGTCGAEILHGLLAALFSVPDSLTPRLLDSTLCSELDEAFV